MFGIMRRPAHGDRALLTGRNVIEGKISLTMEFSESTSPPFRGDIRPLPTNNIFHGC
jgi:hypothetical protein